MIPLLFSVGVAVAADGVDLNRASAAEIDTLPGIGPTKASALVAWREEHGPCRTLDDLVDAPGIGVATIGMLRGRAWCGAMERTAPSPGPKPAAVRPVDINEAALADLMRLPGILAPRAQAILADRTKNGPFASCADLVRVPGIGPATVANLGQTCITH